MKISWTSIIKKALSWSSQDKHKIKDQTLSQIPAPFIFPLFPVFYLKSKNPCQSNLWWKICVDTIYGYRLINGLNFWSGNQMQHDAFLSFMIMICHSIFQIIKYYWTNEFSINTTNCDYTVDLSFVMLSKLLLKSQQKTCIISKLHNIIIF